MFTLLYSIAFSPKTFLQFPASSSPSPSERQHNISYALVMASPVLSLAMECLRTGISFWFSYADFVFHVSSKCDKYLILEFLICGFLKFITLQIL